MKEFMNLASEARACSEDELGAELGAPAADPEMSQHYARPKLFGASWRPLGKAKEEESNRR